MTELDLVKFGNIKRVYIVNKPETLKKFINSEKLNMFTTYIVHYDILRTLSRIIENKFLMNKHYALCFLFDFKAMNNDEYNMLVKKMKFLSDNYNKLVVLILNTIQFNTVVFKLKKEKKNDLFQEILDVINIKKEKKRIEL